MKYFLTFGLLLFLTSISLAQAIHSDTEDSTNRATFIFKTYDGRRIISRNIIATSIDIDSIHIYTAKQFHEKFSNVKAKTGMFLYFKADAKVVDLKQLLKHFNVGNIPDGCKIQINDQMPVDTKNLFASIQSVCAIKLDSTNKILKISLKTP